MSKENPSGLRKLATTEDIAEATSHSVKYIQQLCREKRIPHIPIGREYRFEPERVNAWFREIEEGGETS